MDLRRYSSPDVSIVRSSSLEEGSRRVVARAPPGPEGRLPLGLGLEDLNLEFDPSLKAKSKAKHLHFVDARD